MAKLGKAKEPKLTRALSPQDGHLMSQGDGLKLQRGAAANTEREQVHERGKNCDHAHDGVVVKISPTFSTFRRFEQAQGVFCHRLSRRHSFLKER